MENLSPVKMNIFAGAPLKNPKCVFRRQYSLSADPVSFEWLATERSNEHPQSEQSCCASLVAEGRRGYGATELSAGLRMIERIVLSGY